MTSLAELSRIDLALAREPRHPGGDAETRLTLVLPLTSDGRIDQAAFSRLKSDCRASLLENGVRRSGPIAHHGSTWSLELDGGSVPTFRLGEERLELGEYISVGTEPATHVYRVMSVQPL